MHVLTCQTHTVQQEVGPHINSDEQHMLLITEFI
jgi:hypothetical protein